MLSFRPSIPAEIFSRHKPTIKLNVENPNVVFRASHRYEEPFNLTGWVELETHTPLLVKDVKIIHKGFRKVVYVVRQFTDSFNDGGQHHNNPGRLNANNPHEQLIQQEDCILSTETQLHSSSHTTDSDRESICGIRTWPFSIALSSHIPETVDGLQSSYIQYSLTAEISTGGWKKIYRSAQNIYVTKSPGFWADDIHLLEQTTDIWPNKLSYQVSSQKLYQAHERDMVINFALTPLKRDMRIGKIHVELIQTRILIATKDGRSWCEDKSSTTIASTVSSAHSHDKESHASGHPDPIGELEMRDEALRFPVILHVDAARHRLMQTVEDEKIKIRHALKVCVDLLNPEGHISKLIVEFHPRLCASINHVEAVGQQFEGPDGAITPPPYGDHVFDEIYGAEEYVEPELPVYQT